MSLPKFNEETNNIQGLADKPTQSASQLKALFDKIGTDIKAYINGTLTTAIDTELGNKANSSNVYTKTEVDNKLSDSGWQTLTILDTGFSSASYVRYRKIGKLVEVQGALQRSNSPITTSILIATLPGDYRPSKDLYQYGLGYTNKEKFEIRIGFTGEVRVRPMESSGSIYGYEIINICMLYMID